MFACYFSMRITNNISYQQYYSRSNSCSVGNNGSNANDSVNFTSLPQVVADKCANIVYNPLKNFREFSVREYSTLTPTQLKVLRKRFEHLADKSGYFYRNAEIIHDRASEEIIAKLDDKYGKDKYNLIVLGRSMSSIGKVIGYKLGENRVINIPISGARRFMNCELYPDSTIGGFKNALSHFGLTDETINESGKKFVVMDYCCSGQSLEGGTNLLRRVFGNSENIVSENPMDLLDENILKYGCNILFFDCAYKRFSFVNKSNHLSETVNSVRDLKKADYVVKLVWFKLLDNVMQHKNADLSQISIDSRHLLLRKI